MVLWLKFWNFGIFNGDNSQYIVLFFLWLQLSLKFIDTEEFQRYE